MCQRTITNVPSSTGASLCRPVTGFVAWSDPSLRSTRPAVGPLTCAYAPADRAKRAHLVQWLIYGAVTEEYVVQQVHDVVLPLVSGAGRHG